MASVTLSGVRKRFPNGFEAIRGVDFEIADGEFMVLVGPSGCGKTTLLRSIAGLEQLTEGTILIGDRDVTDEQPGDRDIAMVFQSYALYPHMDVEANLAFGLRRRRTPMQVVRDRVGRIARALALRDLLARRPGMLSGGQRQRVAIGRAMVREPVVYLMDEPLSNLDAKLRVSMRAELARLHDRLGVTTIYVTHDQIEAMTLGDRVCVLRDGEIHQVDTPDRLFNAPANVFVASFIGSPSMNLAVAEIEEGELRFGQYAIELTAEIRRRIGDRRRVVAGMRPSDFRLRASDFADEDGQQPAVARLLAVAEVVERLGAEQLVVFPVEVPRYQVTPQDGGVDDDETLLSDPATSRFTARLDMRRSITHGEQVDLWFDLDRLYLFDEDTGLALAADDATAAAAPTRPVGGSVAPSHIAASAIGSAGRPSG